MAQSPEVVLVRTRAIAAALLFVGFALAAAWTFTRGVEDEGAGEILDYGNAFHFFDTSQINRLFIEITGRLRMLPANGAQREFVALAAHPRESTFASEKDAYSGVIDRADGASSISFVVDEEGNAIISRRYESPQDQSVLYSCGSNPFRATSIVRSKPLSSKSLRRVKSFEDIESAARRGRKLVGAAAYILDGEAVKIDFPVILVNINPRAGQPHVGEDEQWQIVSRRLPLFVGKDDARCDGIRIGNAAFRSFSGPFDIVYLCSDEESAGKSSSDFRCSKRLSGTLELYEVSD